MSVAFRRDGDDEHKEPRFELPIPAGPNLVTAHGLALTQAKVDELEAATLDVPVDDPRRRELRYWRTRLATAQVAPLPGDEEVAFGSRVTVTMGGRTRTIDIVGDDEADPPADRIAFTAPLARALIGAAPGERVPFAGREIEVVATVALAP